MAHDHPEPEVVLALLAPVLLVAVVLAVWWLVGDLSFRAPPGVELDDLLEPPSVSPGVENGVGVAAAAVASTLAAAVVVAVGRGRLPRSWVILLVVLVVCGLTIGWAGRVVTAGGIGANIGAGLVIEFLGPLVGGVLLVCLARAVQLARRSRSRGRQGRPCRSGDR